MTRRPVLVVSFLLALGACSGDGNEAALDETTTTTAAEPTTTREEATTSTVSGCDEEAQAAIDTFETLLDRAEANPETVVGAGDEIDEIMFGIGGRLGQECGQSGIGPALSEIIIYLAGEGARSVTASQFVGGVLSGVCPLGTDIDLTVQAQAACVGSGG